jgi:o-succinylbenzoate synthase
MKILSAQLRPIGGAVFRGVRNARKRWAKREGVLLLLEAPGGLRGVGEASPLPGYSAEDLPAVFNELCSFLPSVQYLPPTPSEIEALCTPLRSPSARFALETALLGLLACTLRTSLHGLFQPAAGPLPRSGLLQETHLDALLEEATIKVERGLCCLKLKIGASSLDRDIELLHALHQALGPAITFRLDANGTLSPQQAASLLQRIAAVPVDLIEEPVAPSDWELLAPPGSSRAPWAADESLLSMADAHLARPGLDAFVLKPAILGFFGALRLATRAIEHHKRVVITHLFDGPIALAAACELALSLPAEHLLPCGLDLHDALHAFPRLFLPQLAVPGFLVPLLEPGLGLRGVHR